MSTEMDKEMANPSYKTKNDRVAEGVNILKQLLGTGVTKDEPAYLQTKALIDRWIIEGKTIEENIEFVRYNRRLTISLPRRADKYAEAVFKTIRMRRS